MGAGETGECWIVERAKEELEMLEAKHPNGFDHLKLELKSFIFDDSSSFEPPHSSAPTQASSNRNKRKKREGEAWEETKLHGSSAGKKREDRAEMAIERAKDCLRRIRLVKESLFPL
ncbi:uncharacterized protein A4U43_C04F34800 [Asparagus officinalis]|uniref:Uncharacterized protein n=1 Tax=Asparagus officinalis TaxID=4686 RepID=A0A5P1F7N1_ASPOF|nr:uncharacterized protein LOC109836202 [Asparagus officinalis]ONK73743.1 uncharacterized protein A4U43_C04F34800 [Asparagus officinalis]